MGRQRIFGLGLIVLLLVGLAVPGLAQSPFATTVVSSNGPFGNWPYDSPNAVLGEPTTTVQDPWSGPERCMVNPAWNVDLNGNPVITTLNSGSQITVAFDHQVMDDPLNPYGIDFNVYGNAFFVGSGWVTPTTNMETYYITNGGVFAEPVTVSVSPNLTDWYTYSSGPFADSYYPTNPYAWDCTNHTWGEQLDWEWPVNPSLTASDFAGLSVADAIDLYDGSAGGTGFDLAKTPWDWIQYVRVEGTGGEIDGFSDVKPTPEPATFVLLGLSLAAIAARRRREHA